MDVLLSIKPKYAEQIISGTKKYEFRKSFVKCDDGVVVYMYKTSPVKKIAGFFTSNMVIKDHPKNLWARFKDVSGINEEEYFKYFGDSERGCAIKINDVKTFEEKDPKTFIPGFNPPQSYYHMNAHMMNCLMKEESLIQD